MAEITGLDDLLKKFQKLGDDMEKALPEIVSEAGGMIKDEIASRIHVGTGTVLNNLSLTSSKEKGSVVATVQIENSQQGGEAHHAIFEEFGTSKMAAKPFFRPGIEASKQKAQDHIVQSLKKIVDDTNNS